MQLEAELASLFVHTFPFIKDYLVKLKSLHSQLRGCGKDKSDKECIFLILSKLVGVFIFCYFLLFHYGWVGCTICNAII